jgi:hypothetical protein
MIIKAYNWGSSRIVSQSNSRNANSRFGLRALQKCWEQKLCVNNVGHVINGKPNTQRSCEKNWLAIMHIAILLLNVLLVIHGLQWDACFHEFVDKGMTSRRFKRECVVIVHKECQKRMAHHRVNKASPRRVESTRRRSLKNSTIAT